MSDCFDHEGDAWSSLDFENDGEPWWPSRPPTCKLCGKKNLYWAETERGWRLYEGVGPHRCFNSVAAAQREFA